MILELKRIKKWHETKCSTNSILGGVYSIQKCKILIFFKTLLAAPQGDLRISD